MKKLIKYFSLIALTGFSACMKTENNVEPVCDPVEPYAAFKVKDKTSGQDLFFDDKPMYQLGDIYAFRTNDKARQDTIRPKVTGTGADRVFLVLFNVSKQRDTLIIKITGTPEDQLIYTVKKVNSVCEGHQLDKAYFNNAEVNREQGVMVFEK